MSTDKVCHVDCGPSFSFIKFVPTSPDWTFNSDNPDWTFDPDRHTEKVISSKLFLNERMINNFAVP